MKWWSKKSRHTAPTPKLKRWFKWNSCFTVQYLFSLFIGILSVHRISTTQTSYSRVDYRKYSWRCLLASRKIDLIYGIKAWYLVYTPLQIMYIYFCNWKLFRLFYIHSATIDQVLPQSISSFLRYSSLYSNCSLYYAIKWTFRLYIYVYVLRWVNIFHRSLAFLIICTFCMYSQDSMLR